MAKLVTDNEFYCCRCGNRGISIIRQRGKERGSGHLKKIWCLYCKDYVNHCECVPYSKYTYSDFLLEFNNNNFDEKENRRKPFKEFKRDLIKRGGINEQTINCNVRYSW